MTDEHEHAMRVWLEALRAGQQDWPKPTDDRAAAAVIAADRAGLVAEVGRLQDALRKSNEPHWFYLGDDGSSDQCRFGIDDCITEDFEWDNHRHGDHVLQISGARPTPDMWVALHYFTDAEKDERQDDEPYAYTVHATENEARAALKDTRNDADA